MTPEHATQVNEIIRVSPPIAVSFASMAGMSISDLTYAVTALYTVIMIGQHAWEKWIKPCRRGRRGK